MQFLANNFFKNKMLVIVFFQPCFGTCVQFIPKQLREEFSPTRALLILSRSVRCRHKCQALSSTLSLSLFSTSLSLSKLYKCHFIMHLSSLWLPHRPSTHPPFTPSLPSPVLSQCSAFPFLSSLFYHSAPLLDNPAWILPSVFTVKKPHNWISYICLFLNHSN